MTDQEHSNSNNSKSSPGVQKTPVFALIVVALLAVAAVGMSVFAWYQVAVISKLEMGAQGNAVERIVEDIGEVRNRSQRSAETVESLHQQVSALQLKLEQGLQQAGQQRNRQFTQFRQEFDALTQSIEKVYQDLGRTVNSWMLEEAEQLLLLANQRLSLDADVDLAKTALQLADEKLEDIGDPGLLPIRRELATEIAELASVPQLDIAGIALRLRALMQSVDKLPLSEDMSGPEWDTGESAEQPGAGNEDVMTSIKSAGEELVEDLKKLVRIRKVEDTGIVRRDTAVGLCRIVFSGAIYPAQFQGKV